MRFRGQPGQAANGFRQGSGQGVPLADHQIQGNEIYHSFRAAVGWDQA